MAHSEQGGDAADTMMAARDGLGRSLYELETVITQKLTSTAGLVRQLAEARAQIEDQQAAIEARDSEIDELRLQANTNAEADSTTDDDIAQMRADLEAKQEVIKELERERAETISANQAYADEIAQLNAALSAAKAEAADLVGDSAADGTGGGTLVEAASLADELSVLRAAHENLEARYAKVTTELETVRQETVAAQNGHDADQQSEEVAELLSANNQLRSKLADVMARINGLISHGDEALGRS
ncbi:MAG: hypothetical protein AAGF15_01735 [Pseudomonadota bacterium]